MKDFLNKILAFLKNEKDSIIKPTAVLLAICIIIPLALAVTNKITSPNIAKLEEKTAQEALKELVPSADKFIEDTIDGVKYNTAQKKGENIAFIFTTKAKGYGGKDSVTVMTAVSLSGEVLNLKVLDVSNETPGLGQNASNRDWYKQFIGKSDNIQLEDIKALTSATITSKAVLSAVNEALDLFSKINKPCIEDGVISPEDSIAIPETPEANPEETEVMTDEK